MVQFTTRWHHMVFSTRYKPVEVGDVECSEAVGDGQDTQQQELVTEVHAELQTLL